MSPDGTMLGRYRLIERIAAGGMAEVYLARMAVGAGLEKTVVVKTILPQYSSEADFGRMLLDEARIGFELRHQNIAQILDVGQEADTLFIAIEHVEGIDMARAERLARQAGELTVGRGQEAASAGLRPLPGERPRTSPMPSARQRPTTTIDPLLVTFIGVEVLRALDYAHRRTGSDGGALHIIHRDISPHNILLSAEGEVKLTDFGIARARDRLVQTTTGGTKGKLAYMAPEQARGETIDQRVDLFGLAATLYEALCGEPPFSGDSAVEVLEQARRGLVTPLAERCPDLDRVLCAVIDQALSPRAEDRPASASAMCEPLEALLAGHASPERALAGWVTHLVDVGRRQADHNQRFARAILSQGTDTNLALGTPTKPTIARPNPRPAKRTEPMLVPASALDPQSAAASASALPARTGVVQPNTVVVPRSRATLLAVILVAVGALAALAIVKLTAGGNPGDAASNRAQPAPPAGAVLADRTLDAAPDPVALEPIAATTPEDAAPIAATSPDAAPTRPHPSKRPRPAVKQGAVTITSWPWAEVRVDGKYYGNTPARRLEIRAGKHRLELSNPETGQSVTATIEVVAGEHRSYPFKLGQ